MARRYRCSACGEEGVPKNLTWCAVANWEHRYEREYALPAHAERIRSWPLSLLTRLRELPR